VLRAKKDEDGGALELLVAEPALGVKLNSLLPPNTALKLSGVLGLRSSILVKAQHLGTCKKAKAYVMVRRFYQWQLLRRHCSCAYSCSFRLSLKQLHTHTHTSYARPCSRPIISVLQRVCLPIHRVSLAHRDAQAQICPNLRLSVEFEVDWRR